MKPSLAIISPNFWDKKAAGIFRGGAELHAASLIEALHGIGFDITVYQRGEKDEELASLRTCRVIALSGAGGRFIRKCVDICCGNGQGMHFNDLELVPRLGRRSTWVSATFHGTRWDIGADGVVPPHYWQPLFRPKIARLAYARLMRNRQHNGLLNVDRVVSVDSTLVRYAQWFAPESVSRISYVPNFVDTAAYYPIPQEHQVRKEEPRPVIFFPRNFSVPRGISLIPGIIRRLKHHGIDPVIVIAGQSISNSPAHSALLHDLERHEITGNVKFVGSLPASEMHYWYNRAHAVLVPSIYSEGTSLAALEAMACGRPVVATNVGGLTDIIQDRWNGRICGVNVDEIGDALSELLLERKTARMYGANALASVNKTHSFSVWREKIVAAFSDLG